MLALGSGVVLTQPGTPRSLVALAGALLALLLPGIALTRALFPGRGMGRAERSILVIGLQFAIVILSGFLLQLLPSGLSAAAWGDLLADITIVGCVVAWIRGRPVAADERMGAVDGPGSSPGLLALVAKLPTAQLGMLIGAGVLVALALGVARAGVAWQPQPAWTALSIEPKPMVVEPSRSVSPTLKGIPRRTGSWRPSTASH